MALSQFIAWNIENWSLIDRRQTPLLNPINLCVVLYWAIDRYRMLHASCLIENLHQIPSNTEHCKNPDEVSRIFSDLCSIGLEAPKIDASVNCRWFGFSRASIHLNQPFSESNSIQEDETTVTKFEHASIYVNIGSLYSAHIYMHWAHHSFYMVFIHIE